MKNREGLGNAGWWGMRQQGMKNEGGKVQEEEMDDNEEETINNK